MRYTLCITQYKLSRIFLGVCVEGLCGAGAPARCLWPSLRRARKDREGQDFGKALREGCGRTRPGKGTTSVVPLSLSKNQQRLEDVQIPSILSSRPEQIIAKR